MVQPLVIPGELRLASTAGVGDSGPPAGAPTPPVSTSSLPCFLRPWSFSPHSGDAQGEDLIRSFWSDHSLHQEASSEGAKDSWRDRVPCWPPPEGMGCWGPGHVLPSGLTAAGGAGRLPAEACWGPVALGCFWREDMQLPLLWAPSCWGPSSGQRLRAPSLCGHVQGVPRPWGVRPHAAGTLLTEPVNHRPRALSPRGPAATV